LGSVHGTTAGDCRIWYPGSLCSTLHTPRSESRSFPSSCLRCGLQTCYEDEMPPLGAVNKPHCSRMTIDVVLYPGSFFFMSFFLLFPNYNTFKLGTYYCYKILPLQAGTKQWQLSLFVQVSFFSCLFFFQLIIILSFRFLGCKITTTTMTRFHFYEPRTSYVGELTFLNPPPPTFT